MHNMYSEIFFVALDNSLIFKDKKFTPYTCFRIYPSTEPNSPQYYGCLDLARAYVLHIYQAFLLAFHPLYLKELESV